MQKYKNPLKNKGGNYLYQNVMYIREEKNQRYILVIYWRISKLINNIQSFAWVSFVIALMLSAILLLDRSYILQNFHHHHHSIFKCVNQYKQRIKEITPVSQSESVHKSYNMHQFPVLLLCWERCLIIYHPIWMEILQPFFFSFFFFSSPSWWLFLYSLC